MKIKLFIKSFTLVLFFAFFLMALPAMAGPTPPANTSADVDAHLPDRSNRPIPQDEIKDDLDIGAPGDDDDDDTIIIEDPKDDMGRQIVISGMWWNCEQGATKTMDLGAASYCSGTNYISCKNIILTYKCDDGKWVLDSMKGEKCEVTTNSEFCSKK